MLNVRTGGSWQATVTSSAGEEIALTGTYHEVSEPDRLVMTVPGGTVTAIALVAASTSTTEIAYSFDIDEPLRAVVTEGVDDVLGRLSKALAKIG